MELSACNVLLMSFFGLPILALLLWGGYNLVGHLSETAVFMRSAMKPAYGIATLSLLIVGGMALYQNVNVVPCHKQDAISRAVGSKAPVSLAAVSGLPCNCGCGGHK